MSSYNGFGPTCGGCGHKNEPHSLRCSECGRSLFVKSVATKKAAPVKIKNATGGASPVIKPRAVKRKYNDSIYKCGCGHSLDVHNEKGCKVTNLMTGEPCECDGFKR